MVVEPDSGARHQARDEAAEPLVMLVVGGAGLPGEVGALEGERLPAGPAADHVTEDGLEDPGASSQHHPPIHRGSVLLGSVFLAFPAHAGGDRGEHRLPVPIQDPVDEPWMCREPAVGEYGLGGGGLRRCDLAAPESQGEAARQPLPIEAEVRDVVEGEVHSDLAQEPDRDQVARLHERLAHPGRAGVAGRAHAGVLVSRARV